MKSWALRPACFDRRPNMVGGLVDEEIDLADGGEQRQQFGVVSRDAGSSGRKRRKPSQS